MEYILNRKKKCLEPAKCRHCKYFVWSDYKVFMGHCSLFNDNRSNASYLCSRGVIKEWLLPPVNYVQLNLFKDG